MDVINRLKSTITNVITGNPLIGEFEILDHKGSGGPGMLWRIHAGMKRSTKQEVSLFIFDKKQLEHYPRRDRDLIVDVLKKGVQQMTRLRHPKILSVLHPVEESREVLAFATEPVMMSLANILGNVTNLPASVRMDIKEYKLYDVEIKYGLLHVTEGLSFLHNDVKMIHSGLCPESIYLNKSGSWKLSGFDFCIPNANQQDSSPYYPFKEWEPHLPPVTKPNLNYLAPEYALMQSCDTSSDLFSLGMLMYAIFNGGKTLYDCHGEWNTFKQNAQELKRLKPSILGSVPMEVRDHVKMLLNSEPTVRPDADQISKIPFFEDVGAMTLQYMDTLMQRDNLQKSQFFKGMPKIIQKMPKRVCLQRILPALFSECTNANMIPFVLPNVMEIAEQCTEKEFAQQILPGLIPIFSLRDPIQITLLFLQHMNLLLSKTPQNDIRNHVLPMVYRALESGTPQIQEMALNIIPTFASLIEYTQMKAALVPRIRKLCLGTTTLRLRVNCLVCLGKLLEYMDKWYVLDEILPIMTQIPSREPAVLMGMLGIFKVASEHKKLGITKEVMANKVLPFLIPLSIDNNLNLQQFNAYFNLITDMITKIETEHRAKLEQLDTMQQEQRTLQQFAQQTFQEEEAQKGINKDNTMMDKFLSGIGLGNLLGPIASNEKKPEVSNPLNDLEKPEAKPEEKQSINKPAKTNLTMAEKQRLAREQEQHQRLKQQPALTAKPITPATTKSQVKDLTATLLSSNFMSTASSVGTMGGSSSFGSTVGSSTMFGTGVGGTLGGTATPSFGAMSGPTMAVQPYGLPMLNNQQNKKNIDMSPLDDLLPSSSSKIPINKMAAKTPGSSAGFSQVAPQSTMMARPNAMPNTGMVAGMRPMAPPPQGIMGNPGIMGNQGIMGNPGMMGNPSMMGNQGMLGNTGVGQVMPAPTGTRSQNGDVKKLSNQDLADFLG